MAFQVYVNSYIALLNARYYLQPKDSGAIDTLELRTRPALRSRVSEAGNLQEPRKIVFKHPYDHDDQLHHTHPSQAVMVSGCINVDKRVLSDALANGRLEEFFLVSSIDNTACIDYCPRLLTIK
jgi:hypothetical protein